MKSITSLSIYLIIHLPSLYLLSFILGSKYRHISHPVLSYCFLGGIGTAISNSVVISVINKGSYGGVGGLMRYMSKEESLHISQSPEANTVEAASNQRGPQSECEVTAGPRGSRPSLRRLCSPESSCQ